MIKQITIYELLPLLRKRKWNFQDGQYQHKE